jgi:hypothetical protein
MNSARKVDIGIICSEGLGDTLLQMIIAYNLAENGFEVTFYSNYAYHLRDKVHGYRIEPFPCEHQAKRMLSSHHTFIYDQGSPYYKRFSQSSFEWILKNGIGYKMSSGQPVSAQISQAELLSRMNTCFDAKCRSNQILAFNNSIRAPSFGFYREPKTLQVAWFLKNIVGLENVSIETGFRLQGCATKSNRNRVVIHPTSSDIKKNWLIENYIQFAKWLERDGFTPVFTVSPTEREQCLESVTGQFEVPIFNSISELASYYSESAWFIGNDSGNAHLASCVGLPTFQLFGRWRTTPSWRAGWAVNKVLTAKFPYKFSHKNWQAGLTPARAYQQFELWHQAVLDAHQPNLLV